MGDQLIIEIVKTLTTYREEILMKTSMWPTTKWISGIQNLSTCSLLILFLIRPYINICHFFNVTIDIDILLVSFIVRCTGRSQRQERGSGLFALVSGEPFISFKLFPLVSFPHFYSICLHKHALWLVVLSFFCILIFSCNQKGIIHQLCMYRSYLVFQIKLSILVLVFDQNFHHHNHYLTEYEIQANVT